MKEIRVVIIDDEPAAIEVIRELISQLANDLVLLGVAYNGLEAIQVLNRCRPDLIFLDVDMPLLNGIQTLEKVGSDAFKVIFTTGSANYALSALKLNAVDYLLKPIDPADFMIAVEKSRKILALENNAAKEKSEKTRIQFPTQNGIIFLEEANILHVAGMGSYCHIYTADHTEKITVSKNIGQVEERLSDDFFRCHNSHIINVDAVTNYSTKNGFSVVLRDGSVVEVSRRNKENLLKKLNQHSK